MLQIPEESIQDFTTAFNLLNEVEVRGIQNINALGNSATLFKRFFESIKKIDDVPKDAKEENENDS